MSAMVFQNEEGFTVVEPKLSNQQNELQLALYTEALSKEGLILEGLKQEPEEADVIFFPEEHKYTLGGVELIPVSKFLEKWGISPWGNYTSAYIEKRKADGTYFHKEADLVAKGVLELDDMLSPESVTFKEWYSALPSRPLYSEKIIHYKTIYAGTCDMIYQDKDGLLVLVDYKTGAYHKRQHAWQLTLYKKALAEMGIKIDRMEIWCFKDNTIHEVDEIPEAEVNELLEKEARGESPKSEDLDEATGGKLTKLINLHRAAMEAQVYVDASDKAIETTKAEILEYMLKNNVDTNANNRDVVRLSSIRPSTRRQFDSKAFEKAQPDVYKNYLKESSIKASLRVTWRDEE